MNFSSKLTGLPFAADWRCFLNTTRHSVNFGCVFFVQCQNFWHRFISVDRLNVLCLHTDSTHTQRVQFFIRKHSVRSMWLCSLMRACCTVEVDGDVTNAEHRIIQFWTRRDVFHSFDLVCVHTAQCNVVIVARTIFYCCKLRVNKKGVKIEANIYSSCFCWKRLDRRFGESDSCPTTGFGTLALLSLMFDRIVNGSRVSTLWVAMNLLHDCVSEYVTVTSYKRIPNN